uniref:TolC family protein n=1 Tax=candidate division WOR-3 bacterium TaxID=2052148 RepID=A0A7C4GFI2_UNCW3
MRRLASCLVLSLMLTGTAALAADTLHLDVDRAVELALANSRQLAQAQARLDEAVAGKGTALGAFLPQITANATYTRLGRANELTMLSARDSIIMVPVLDPEGNPIGRTALPVRVPVGVDTFSLTLGSVNNYALSGTIQQTLFTWGKLVNAYRIAGINVELQKQAAAQARAQVRVDAVQSFYQALLARRTAETMREALRQLEGHVRRVQSLYDNGLATRLDVMKATLGQQQLEAQLAQVEGGAELAQAVLLNTLGLDPQTPLAFTEELTPETSSVDVDQVITLALARRPELIQLREAARIADLSARIALTANLPTAFVQATGSYKNPLGFTSEWGADWNATAGLTMPVFTGLANYNRLKAAQARLRQARIAVTLVEDAVRLEVRAQALALNQEAKNAALQEKNVELAEAALALARSRYEDGLLTNLEYLDTQLALTQSRIAYLNALANCRIARARLQKAVGEN